MKKYDFDENMIKGRIAEALIEQLFLSMGYEVYRYGMENTIPGIRHIIRNSYPEEVVQEISKMPDFVIKHPNSDMVCYLESKFRANGNFSVKDIFGDTPELFPYKNAYFVVVSKRHIKCLSYAELMEGEEILGDERKHFLGDHPDFIKHANRNDIIKFCKFVLKFFKEV